MAVSPLKTDYVGKMAWMKNGGCLLDCFCVDVCDDEGTLWCFALWCISLLFPPSGVIDGSVPSFSVLLVPVLTMPEGVVDAPLAVEEVAVLELLSHGLVVGGSWGTVRTKGPCQKLDMH